MYDQNECVVYNIVWNYCYYF